MTFARKRKLDSAAEAREEGQPSRIPLSTVEGPEGSFLAGQALSGNPTRPQSPHGSSFVARGYLWRCWGLKRGTRQLKNGSRAAGRDVGQAKASGERVRARCTSAAL